MKENIGTVDIGGTQARFGIATSDGRSAELVATRLRPSSFMDFAEQLSLVFPNMSSLAGLSVCVPGPVKHSKIGLAPNLSWLSGFDLKSALEARFAQPVRVFNDMVAAAMGECLERSLAIEADTLMVTLSTGIGGCRMRRHAGRRIELVPMEIGHIAHPHGNGEHCGCGKCNCFEATCSGSSASRMVRNFLPPWVDHRVDACAYLDEQAAASNELALSFYERMGEKIGIGLALILEANPAIEQVVYTGSFGIHGMPYMKTAISRTLQARLKRDSAIVLFPVRDFRMGPHKGCALLFGVEVGMLERQIIVCDGIAPEQILTPGESVNRGIASHEKDHQIEETAGVWPDGFPDSVLQRMRDAAVSAALDVLGRDFQGHAEEIAQDTIGDASKRPQGIKDPVAWAWIVARRRALNFVKRQRRVDSLEEGESGVQFVLESRVFDAATLQEIRSSFPSILSILYRLIDRLDDLDKEIFINRHRNGLDDRTIAELTGLTPENVRQRWYRTQLELHVVFLRELKRKPLPVQELYLGPLSNRDVFKALLDVSNQSDGFEQFVRGV